MNVLPLLTTSFVVRRPLFVCGCYINNVNVNNVVRRVVGVLWLLSLYVCRFLTNTVRRDVVCASSINNVNVNVNNVVRRSSFVVRRSSFVVGGL